MTRILTYGALAVLMLGTLRPARSQAEVVRPQPMAYAVSEGITAQGHAEVMAQPDIALITVGVITKSKDQADAVAQNASRTTAVLRALRAAGIADKDVETESYAVVPQYDSGNGGFGGGSRKPSTLTGYVVINSVQAKVHDLTRVGLVIDKATAVGASQITGVSFDLADRGKAQASALALAVVTARLKAAVMAQAAGVDLGRLLSVTEGGTTPVHPVFATRLMTAEAQTVQTPIAKQQITVTADATLVYAMGAAK